MKKILTMAAVALLAASCSNDKDVITPDLGTANAPVAIKLTQSVEGITTKAPITSGSQVEGIVVMVDVTSGHEHDWGSFNPVYKNEIYKGIENSCQRSRRCIYGWDRDGYYLDSHLVL